MHGFGQAAVPAIGVHGVVTHKLKANLIAQIFDLRPLIINDPTVIDCKDYVGPHPFCNFTNPRLTKRLVLIHVGGRIHEVLLLQRSIVSVPVAAKHVDLIPILQTAQYVFGNTSKTSGSNNVTYPQKLGLIFSHLNSY